MHVFTAVADSIVTRVRIYTTGAGNGVGELFPSSLIGSKDLNTKTISDAGGCQVTFKVVNGGWAELRFANGATPGCKLTTAGAPGGEEGYRHPTSAGQRGSLM